MKKYEWRPTANAPKYYPAEIISGHFYMEDGSDIYIPTGHTLITGWGLTGAAHIVGEDFKPVPHKFDIKWVSFLEEKFYGGTFELPKEKMLALFEEGFVNSRNVYETYDSIVLGLAPGGVVVVWLYGSFTVEIARFQATEVQTTMEEYAPGADRTRTPLEHAKVIKEIIIEEDIKGAIDVENIPFGKWDAYRKRYSWAPDIRFKQDGETELKWILVNSYNGEFFSTYGQNPVITEIKERPVPYRIKIGWKDALENHYGAKVDFDETEIWAAFDTMFDDEDTENAEMVIEVDQYNSDLTIRLETQRDTVTIQKAKIKVYNSSPD